MERAGRALSTRSPMPYATYGRRQAEVIVDCVFCPGRRRIALAPGPSVRNRCHRVRRVVPVGSDRRRSDDLRVLVRLAKRERAAARAALSELVRCGSALLDDRCARNHPKEKRAAPPASLPGARAACPAWGAGQRWKSAPGRRSEHRPSPVDHLSVVVARGAGTRIWRPGSDHASVRRRDRWGAGSRGRCACRCRRSGRSPGRPRRPRTPSARRRGRPSSACWCRARTARP